MNWLLTNRSGRPRDRAMASSQAGVTLIELAISMALSLLVVMAATALLQSAKAGYLRQDEGAHIQDTGRHAIELIARAVRQAGYENWDGDQAPMVMTTDLGPHITGLDARSVKRTGEGITSSSTRSVNGSDVLAVRYSGSGVGSQADGTIVNCAGFGVPAVASAQGTEKARGWSIFYVAHAANGTPELYCKYIGKSGKWTSEPIASGVESFQVLYGLDTDEDGLPNQYMSAEKIDALDQDPGPDKSGMTNWKKVVIIKVALLLRGSGSSRQVVPSVEYDLFEKDYTDEYANEDIGTRINQADLPRTLKNSVRKTFSATIKLRNQPLGNAA
jgi:type IV pilus assembly protein PilW